MTFFDLHPLDLRRARFEVIATLILLSRLGAVRPCDAPDTNARPRRPGRVQPAQKRYHGGARLVRPPRSC